MGRELRRKEAKRQGKSLKEKSVNKVKEDSYNDVYKMLKTFGIILGVILVIYFLIAVLITKEIDWFGSKNNTNTTENTVKNAILASETFKQKDETYYVYYYDFNKEDSTITNLISSKITDTVYKVDTSDAFNSNYVSTENGNSNATSLEELKVINPTLIKITNDEIVSYYETKDSIVNYLKQ